MNADALVLVAGVALLLGVVMPTLLSRVALSAPIVLLAAGVAIGFLPLPDGLVVSPLEHPVAAEHLTEACVVVSLMGVGLALDRPLDIRRLASWRSWRATWGLLVFGIPLGIALVALTGWWLLGLAPAVALLLGAVLAPTDPVLASDVQVGGPTERPGTSSPDSDAPDADADTAGGDDQDETVDEDDEVRFALTSEAGLNDGLAFPFVYLALLVAAGGATAAGLAGWAAWDLLGRSVIGVLVGAGTGWVLAKVAFRAPRPSLRLAEAGEPLLAVAAILLAYGLAELVSGYGFLAVFCCGLALRSLERGHGYHAAMHAVVERLERLLTLVVLLLLGVAVAQGLLSGLTWGGALIGILLVFVIRPVTGWLVLHPSMPAGPQRISGRLRPRERIVTAFYGIRGVGSLYYLSYGLTHSDGFGDPGPLWAIVGFAVVLSVVVHGITATPVMRWLDDVRYQVADEQPAPG
ncbi:MAG TPA: cation:proton antiporter [Pseudonocardia sp.]|nr:cation:proton antiporter [Pseudonocardia sp.]